MGNCMGKGSRKVVNPIALWRARMKMLKTFRKLIIYNSYSKNLLLVLFWGMDNFLLSCGLPPNGGNKKVVIYINW